MVHPCLWKTPRLRHSHSHRPGTHRGGGGGGFRIIMLIMIIIIISRFRYTYQWHSTTITSWRGSTCLTLRRVTWWDTVSTSKPSKVRLILANSHSKTWWEKVPKFVQ